MALPHGQSHVALQFGQVAEDRQEHIAKTAAWRWGLLNNSANNVKRCGGSRRFAEKYDADQSMGDLLGLVVETGIMGETGMRLTVKTNLALRTLMFCAVNKGRTVRKAEIAEACAASENHLAQVIHKLAQAGYVTTVRGRTGGLRMRRDPASLRVGEVVRCFEGCLALTECLEPDGGSCPLRASCVLKNVFSSAMEAFYGALDKWSLADLVDDNAGLIRLLKVA